MTEAVQIKGCEWMLDLLALPGIKKVRIVEVLGTWDREARGIVNVGWVSVTWGYEVPHVVEAAFRVKG
jgi:hypothetical protein